MWQTRADESANDVYLAGERVLAGTYRQVGGGREIQMDAEGALPASLDGRVACYMRVHSTWAQLAAQGVAVVGGSKS